jgi:phosphatidylglycerol:prolipoprotein diacylglycerol transferase
MFPVITKIGGFTLHTFGVVLAVAILVGSSVLIRELRRLNDPQITEARMQRLIWYIVLAVILGGRLLYVITAWDQDHFGDHPMQIFAIWEGGLVMYGGLLAVFGAVIGFAIKNKINILRLCDLVAPSCFLGDAIGRWGCFFAGDDYGRPIPPDAPGWVQAIGIKFTDPQSLVPPNLRGVALYPTEIMMSLKAAIIAVVLFWLTRRKKFDGQIAGWAFMMYAVLRSLIEFFRGDDDRGFVGPMSTSQFISIFVFAGGLLILMLAPKKTLADDLAAAKAQPAAAPVKVKAQGKKRK